MPNRYLVLTELFVPTKGGTEVWFDKVYRRLGSREIHILNADVRGASGYELGHPNSVHGLNLHRIPWLRPESLGMHLKIPGKALQLALMNLFDAIHVGRSLPEGLVAWVVAHLIRRQVIPYAHGEKFTDWDKGNKYRVMCFTLRHAGKVVANRDFARDTLIGMGDNRERFELVQSGIDTERFHLGRHMVAAWMRMCLPG